jgi:hypothetical protein
MSDTEDRPTGLSQWDRNDEVARTLYAEYNARFLSDNGRIWTTAATMVPLSLGSFALLASIKHPSRAQVIALPLIGLCLMTFWLAIAAKHRVFQEASLQNCDAIEAKWGFSAKPPARKRVKIWFIRWLMWGTVLIAAVLVILFWPGGIFTSDTPPNPPKTCLVGLTGVAGR